MSKKLKVGVIGVGGIARLHFPGWKPRHSPVPCGRFSDDS